MTGIVQLIGRVMLALIFVLAGVGKISDPAGTAAYMQSMGVPGLLLWPTIALEVLGGLALIIGYKTRLVAAALAIFTVAAAVIFHNNFQDQLQMIMFLKDIAIAGGLLLLAAGNITAYSIDSKQKQSNFFATRN